jgi:hypothetical protein
MSDNNIQFKHDFFKQAGTALVSYLDKLLNVPLTSAIPNMTKFPIMIKNTGDETFITNMHESANAETLYGLVPRLTLDVGGMSGSFPKEDTYEMMEIMAKTGPIVSIVKAKKLMDEGYITKVKIKGILMQHNDFEFADLLETVASADKKSAYDLEVAKIQESEERLGVISQIVGQCKSLTIKR